MVRLLVISCLLVNAVEAAVGDGSALFAKHCAQCHNPGGANRTPTPDMLKRLSQDTIRAALQAGTMKAQGAALSASEKAAVAEYLGSGVKTSSGKNDMCASNPLLAGLDGWNGWSTDLTNTRYQPGEKAGLAASDVPKLKLKWAFGLPNSLSTFGQPTIAGGRLFFGSSSGTVYSLDTASGCAYWTFKAPTMVRTAITIASVNEGRFAAYFGDTHATMYAVDAHNGELIWKTEVDDHKMARITGAPKLVEGHLYVPVASGVEEMAASSAGYPCCTFRGSLAALDAATGKQIWKTYTIPDPPVSTGENAIGTKKFGPSGASIWSSPTIDLKRRLIYAGTGNNYSDPATRYSDAVIAFDMDSGSVRWIKQLKPGDAWNGGCLRPDKSGCPEAAGGDTDIGASPILRTVDGRAVLVIGQKSGVVYGIDPEHQGEVLWETRVGHGGALGGVMWGLAAEPERVYVPLSDFAGPKPDAGGGLFAINIGDGKITWHAPPEKPGCAGKEGCSAAQMAPATLIPGIVFSGSMDGHLRAYATADGSIVWDLDTLRDFDTVNGVKAHGGSLNATGPTIADGMLFVNSGYGQLGGMPGNVLLAFSTQGK